MRSEFKKGFEINDILTFEDTEFFLKGSIIF